MLNPLGHGDALAYLEAKRAFEREVIKGHTGRTAGTVAQAERIAAARKVMRAAEVRDKRHAIAAWADLGGRTIHL
jgi:N-dimethylarginine dimethylaminohydrolase